VQKFFSKDLLWIYLDILRFFYTFFKILFYVNFYAIASYSSIILLYIMLSSFDFGLIMHVTSFITFIVFLFKMLLLLYLWLDLFVFIFYRWRRLSTVETYDRFNFCIFKIFNL